MNFKMPKDRKHRCSYCGIKFAHISHLRGHIETIHDKCPYLPSEASIEAIHENDKSNAQENVQDQGDHIQNHDEAERKVKEHECKECGHKFSKLSKLVKHISKKHHKIGDINGNNPVLTLEDISERSKVQEKDNTVTVTEDAQENVQDKADHTKAERKGKDKSEFVDGEPWTCAMCGFTSSKWRELALHLKAARLHVQCGPAEAK